MTLHIGLERHDEFDNAYYPIVDENDEIVGTAYDKKTAALFAAAGEMREALRECAIFYERFTSVIPKRIAALLKKTEDIV